LPYRALVNEKYEDFAATYGPVGLRVLRRWVDDEIAFWGRCKRAAILADWMDGVSIQEIERS